MWYSWEEIHTVTSALQSANWCDVCEKSFTQTRTLQRRMPTNIGDWFFYLCGVYKNQYYWSVNYLSFQLDWCWEFYIWYYLKLFRNFQIEKLLLFVSHGIITISILKPYFAEKIQNQTKNTELIWLIILSSYR